MQAKPEGERSRTLGRAEPRSGRQEGRWGPQEPRGGHRASCHLHGDRQEALVRKSRPPMWEVKCDALGSCCTSSHPRWKELANDSHQRDAGFL